jgi:nucleotide-binding universal stress UspA family protein
MRCDVENMEKIRSGSRISLKNILFLTDFSEPSEAALPFAVDIARGYGSKVFGLHIFSPTPYVCATSEMVDAALEAEEDAVKAAILRFETQFTGLEYELIVERGSEIWPLVERAIECHKIDLIVLGTHGRTGAEKLLLGSVAEEIFRRALIPALTIGPGVGGVRGIQHTGGHFRRVLFASDFSTASLDAAPYAVSLAQENEARLLLLHVMRQPHKLEGNGEKHFELSVAEAIHRLYETVPNDVQLHFPPEVAVEYGEAAKKIVEAAKQRDADLIVLGVRNGSSAVTHLEASTAHKVVAHAACPVLTVR